MIVDVRLGEFNGLQLVILAKLTHPAVRALVMTGFDDTVTREEAERLGARYLIKPIHANDLTKLLT